LNAFAWEPISLFGARLLTGIGLAAGGVGFASLLLLGLNVGTGFLGGYARLHYRLLKPSLNVP